MKDEKKIPKPVLFWLLLMGFLLGNALGGLILMFNIAIWALLNVIAILMCFILDWKYGEILQEYIPRYKTEEKEEST